MLLLNAYKDLGLVSVIIFGITKKLAHWWGEVHYNNNYMICKTNCVVNEDIVLDLVGNTCQIDLFRKTLKKFQEVINKNKITISLFLEFQQKYNPNFNYQVIRVNGCNCRNKYKKQDTMVRFIESNNSYLDLSPEIQVCFWEKSLLNNKIEIIFPETLSNDFTI